MRAAGMPDAFTVINGPEDGTEFAISQRQFLIGHDSACAVNPRLDVAIEDVHGRCAAVADGYSLRNSGRSPIDVNGKAAGMIRSQIARAGDVIRIGHTELILECSADGIASRSRGIALESDAAWALRHATTFGVDATRWTGDKIMRTMSGMMRNKFSLFMVAGALYLFVPEFRNFATNVWWSMRGLLP